MNIDLPEVPAGILTLLSFFAPYAIALINNPRWSKAQRKIVSVAVPIILAVVVWVIYFAMTGDGLHEWPVMILLAVVIAQASYSLVLKNSAKKVEKATHSDSEI